MHFCACLLNFGKGKREWPEYHAILGISGNQQLKATLMENCHRNLHFASGIKQAGGAVK
jgi:hypothetical protein